MHLRSPLTLVSLLLASALIGCGQRAAEGWSTERSYPYEARMTTRALVGSEVQPSEFSFDMVGVLDVTPLEVTPTRTKLALAVRDVAFKGAEDRKRRKFRPVSLASGRPAVVT